MTANNTFERTGERRVSCRRASRSWLGLEALWPAAQLGRQPSHRDGASILTMIDWSSCNVVEMDPDRVSGAWVFRGTRVPVAALFENLEDGAPVSQFVEWFPGVTIAQARAVLEHAARSALASA